MLVPLSLGFISSAVRAPHQVARPFSRAVLCNNINTIKHNRLNGHPNTIFNMAASASTAAAGVSVGIVQGFPGAVGNTPLVRLASLSDKTGCEILAKAEWMNPGGSVKDRAAKYLVTDAENKGLLKPGGTVVEGTAGNTGIGLAHMCRARGYKCIIYIPETQSKEKMDALRGLGAEVRPVPAVPYKDEMNYNHQAKRCAEGMENAVWADQFDNPSNQLAHYETTGPEILAQTGGKIDAWVAAVGTGGTLAGTSRFLKENVPDIKCFAADPPGASMFAYYTKASMMERSEGGSITEGIGQGRVTGNLATCEGMIDGAFLIPDAETIEMVYNLLHYEGIFVGASSALNMVGAVKTAEAVGKGKTVVSVLCDGAARYQSRLFSKTWLTGKGLYESIPEECRYLVSLE
ncbi:unnamed protein product [Pylaiella littoralis]